MIVVSKRVESFLSAPTGNHIMGRGFVFFLLILWFIKVYELFICVYSQFPSLECSSYLLKNSSPTISISGEFSNPPQDLAGP